MFEFVNLTPHTINPEGMEPLAPSGQVARVKMTSREIKPKRGQTFPAPFLLSTPGEVEGLPAPRKGVLLVVSAMVRTASGRGDLVSPGPQTRDEKGRPVLCHGFEVNPSFEGLEV